MRMPTEGTGSHAGDLANAWTGRLAKIQILRASRGTGWAIGETGVLTARQVIAPLLVARNGKPPDAKAEITLAAAPERSFGCRIVWDDDASGLALLAISERQHTTWRTLLRRSPQPLLAYPPELPLDVTVCGMPGSSARAAGQSSLTWMMAEPETLDGRLSAMDGRRHGTVTVDRDELPRPTRKFGMPGSAVLYHDPEPMMLGIVTAKMGRRHRMRLGVSGVPRSENDAALYEALESVGAHEPVVSMDGTVLRNYVIPDGLDASLEPRPVTELDPGFFGTRKARTDEAPADAPYASYLPRPEEATLRTAIDHALDRTGPPFLVVRGPSAAGKSRLVHQVVTTHPGLTDHRIIAPLHSRSILTLPQRLWPSHAVIWLDNADDFPSNALRHEATRQLLERAPATIVIATVLDHPTHANAPSLVDGGAAAHSDDELSSGHPMTSASLSGLHTVLDDEELAATITVGPSVPGSGSALSAAAARGLGLGEYLSAYHELADQYTAAGWSTRALVELVRDWDRVGIGELITEAVAYPLWQRLAARHLPRGEVQRFGRMTATEMLAVWRSALRFACEPLAGSSSLVRAAPEGLLSAEFTRVHVDQSPVSPAVWDYLMGEHHTTRLQRLTMGVRALRAGTPQRARRAFESVLSYRDDDVVDPADLPLIEAIARRGIALYHARLGRSEQAIMVYTELVDTFTDNDDTDICEQVAQALLGIGITFSELGSHGQAVSAYTELIAKYGDHPSPILDTYVAKGLLGQATTLAQLGRTDEEHAAYRDIVARYDGARTPTLAAIVDVARAAIAPPPSTDAAAE